MPSTPGDPTRFPADVASGDERLYPLVPFIQVGIERFQQVPVITPPTPYQHDEY